MSDSRYTYEEMEIARFTDLPNLAEAFGYEVQARGRWHFLKDAQHIVIKNRTRYFDNYKQEWGDAITFLEDYADMSFREAMDFLLNYNGYARDAPAQKPEIRLPKKEEQQPVPFALPEPNEDNRRVFSYLRKRGIAYQVIENMVNAGLLYEDKQYHNCVFVGRDAAGEAVFAHKRGTHDKDGVGFKGDVEGSNKDIAFRLPCDPKKTSVHVFEAPVDMLSYVHLCLAMSAQAIAQRSTVMRRTQSDNELFTFRVWLVRMGLNGEEFKNTRDHLLKHLEGDKAWRHDKDSYEVNKKKKKKREMER